MSAATTRHFAIAHARGYPGSDWRAVLADCFAQLDDALDAATLGFVYVSDAFNDSLPDIVAELKARTAARWVGSVAIGVSGGATEYFDEPAIALMVANLPPTAFRIVPNLTLGLGETGELSNWLASRGPALGIVHADPRNPRVPALVDRLGGLAGFLVGGLSSSRVSLDQVVDEVVSGGVSGVFLSSEVTVATGLTQGCAPIGPLRRVTGAERNVLFEIDGRPALDVLKKDVGELLARRLERLGGYIHAALPVRGSDTGDYLVRNLVGIDPDRGWVAIGDTVATGDPILFVRRDREAAEQDLTRMLRSLKTRAGGSPKAGLYFSCLARGPNLFGPNSAELAIVRRELGEVPLVGMFCNGEISNGRLYGYTGVLTLFL